MMISKSVRIIGENVWFFLGLIAVQALLLVVQQMGYLKSSQGVMTTIVWLSAMWLIQRAVLFDLKMHQKHPDPAVDKTLARFLGKGFLLCLIGVVLSIPFIVSSLGSFTGQGGPSGFGYLALVGGTLLCITAMLSLLGTWLPAGIYGQETGFGAALSRGAKTFFPVFLRLLAVNIVGCLIVIGLIIAFAASANIASLSARSATILLDVLTSTVGVVSLTYTAVVLAETYLQYEAGH